MHQKLHDFSVYHGNVETSFVDLDHVQCSITVNVGYLPSARSRCLDIGQVIFLRVYRPGP